MVKEKKILLFWEGLPSCALITKKVVSIYGDNLVFIATKPNVPFESFEESIGKKIIWLEHPNDIWHKKDEFTDIDLIIHTGWCWKGWLKFDKLMKKNGTKVCVSVDNRFKFNIRQIIGFFYYRVFFKEVFDFAFVPGNSAFNLMRFLGVANNNIFKGLYGCDEGIFFNKVNFSKRKNQFIFVGQLIHRKGIDILLKAFKEYKSSKGSWGLKIIGSIGWNSEFGNLPDEIEYSKFLQPNELSSEMNNSKCFIFPSRDDHWATVVHEATCCGLPIILTKTVGAYEDLLIEGKNGFLMKNNNSTNLAKLMLEIELLDLNKKLYSFHEKSLEVSKLFGTEAYTKSFNKIVESICEL
jgi:glycosyltransferase involved in cell wall biosynthesis